MTTGNRRWWALAALALSVLVVGIDGTVISLALPTLATDLHASNADLQWFVAAYSLVFAAALLPAGLLGDRFGRKRLLLAALVVFGLGSAACAYAPSAGALIAGRAVLGLGAAFLAPLSMAVLPVIFTPEEQGRALTVWVAANAISWPIGPLVGGWLLDSFWWGSVFLINLPVVAVAITAVVFLLPESRSREKRKLDLAGVLVSSAGLAALTYGLIEAGERGWLSLVTLVALLTGVALLFAFALLERGRERRRAQTLIDLGLFKESRFVWGTALAAIVSFVMVGALFALPQYFQLVLGSDALATGLRLLPLIGGLFAGSVVAGKVAPAIGVKLVVALGFGFLSLGLTLGATTTAGAGYGLAALWTALMGVGLGFGLPPAMNAALATVPKDQSGVGSGLIMAARVMAGTIGVALLGTVLSSAYGSHVVTAGLPAAAAQAVRDSAAAGVAVARQTGSASLLESVRSAFLSGMDTMLWVSVGTAAAGLVLALAFMPGRAAARLSPRRAPEPGGPKPRGGAVESDHELVA